MHLSNAFSNMYILIYPPSFLDVWLLFSSSQEKPPSPFTCGRTYVLVFLISLFLSSNYPRFYIHSGFGIYSTNKVQHLSFWFGLPHSIFPISMHIPELLLVPFHLHQNIILFYLLHVHFIHRQKAIWLFPFPSYCE